MTMVEIVAAATRAAAATTTTTTGIMRSRTRTRARARWSATACPATTGQCGATPAPIWRIRTAVTARAARARSTISTTGLPEAAVLTSTATIAAMPPFPAGRATVGAMRRTTSRRALTVATAAKRRVRMEVTIAATTATRAATPAPTTAPRPRTQRASATGFATPRTEMLRA